MPITIEWDQDQRQVIEANPEDWLLVKSPPGCGKTAVACGRIARLIASGVEPARILLFSFTRTAVAELRNRIIAMSNADPRARGVKITTLDSEVWHLCYGFTNEEVKKLFDSYDANIESVIEKAASEDEQFVEYIQQFRHLIIDEAQDLTGLRARLALALLGSLHSECGVTVFADPAQAIYGFTNEDVDADGDPDLEAFLGEFQTKPEFRTRDVELNQNYRTNDKLLLSIVGDARKILFDDEKNGTDRLRETREIVRHLAPVHDVEAEFDGTTLALFRNRNEVLYQSSLLSVRGVEHRVRMSGMPEVTSPWVAAVLAKFSKRYITQETFEKLWHESHAGNIVGNPGPEKAWELLERVAGDEGGKVQIRELRSVLSRPRPPVEFAKSACGTQGAILGTIHASKGREADRVILHLPAAEYRSGSDLDEEARVVYVGATRARKRLEVGNGRRSYSKKTDSGRCYRIRKPNKAHVEFGRSGDVNNLSTVSMRFVPSSSSCYKSQSLLQAHASRTASITGVVNPDRDWHYSLELGTGKSGGQVVGEFAAQINQDLWSIARDVGGRSRLKPPPRIKHLYLFGVTSVVLPEDHGDLDDLHAPYFETGIFLAPVVKGFTQLYFNEWK